MAFQPIRWLYQSRHAFPRWRALITAALTLLLSTDTLLSQFPEPKFEHILRAPGLPNGEIFSMLMDRQGFLWFGFTSALVRYDGIQFLAIYPRSDPSLPATQSNFYDFLESRNGDFWCATQRGGILRYDPRSHTFTRLTSASHGLSSNDASSVCEDAGGTLWVGTNRGLDTLDVLSGRFCHISRPSRHGPQFVNVSISCIHEFPRGSGMIWIGTYGEGVIRYNHHNREWTNWQVRSGDSHGPPEGNIEQLFMSERNPDVLWVGTPGGGLYRLHVPTGKCDRIALSPARDKNMSPGRVRWISESPEGKLIAATMGTGLYLVDQATGRVKNVSCDSRDQGSLYPEVTCTLVDSSGVLWVATYNGIYKSNPARSLFRSYHYSSEKNKGLTHNSVTGLCEDRNGILWIGTRGGGLNRFNRRTGSWSAYMHDPQNPHSLATDEVGAVFVDRSGNLWVGASGWLHRLRPSTGDFDRWRLIQRSSNYGDTRMWFIHQDFQNAFLIGTGSGLFRFDPRTESVKVLIDDDSASGRAKSGAVVAILEDHNRDLWIGTNTGGLRWLHYQTGAIEIFTHIEGDSASLGAGGVRSLLEDGKGNIWIGTGSGGLNLFDRETKRFKAFTESDGLSGNHVNGLLEDHQGRIWAASTGLCAFDPVTGQWSRFNESDGLQGDVHQIGSRAKCADGTLCFGGLNGLTLFRPDTLYLNTHTPPIMLTTIRLGGRRLVPAMWPPHLTEISYTYSGEVLSLEFAALDFRRPDRNVCLFQMSGVDKDWLKPYGPLGNTANYNLTPGNYIFRVKGANSAGVQGRNILTLAIEVKPRYWETWWFRLIAGGIVVGTIGFLYRRKVARLRREKRLQQDFSRQLIETNETGRKHLAAELHDGLGQNLLVVSNELQQFLHEGNGSHEDVKRAAALVQESIQSVREISSNLHPHHLERLGFCAAVEAMTENIAHSSGLVIDCTCEKVDALLPKEVEIHVYRIIQEALANVVRHAKATKVTLQVQKNTESIEIAVSDNGQGFVGEPGSMGPFSYRREEGVHGLGLTSMTERARIIGGTLDIRSSPGSGATIHLTVPLS